MSITKPVATTVKIQCLAEGLDDIHWYQQRSDQAPRRILRYSKGKSERDQGIPAKFSAEGSDSTFSLVIDNTDLSDAATYYCAGWVSQCDAMTGVRYKNPSSLSGSLTARRALGTPVYCQGERSQSISGIGIAFTDTLTLRL